MTLLRLIVCVLAMGTLAHAETTLCTSYTHTEDKRWGILNCQGGKLDESQCAADLRVYPLGSRLEITLADGTKLVRLVTDCGSAVKGRHIDIYWKSVIRMNRFGSQLLEVRRIKLDASAIWRTGAFKSHHKTLAPWCARE